jgi:arylsulfatase A-like enzyme
MNYTKRINYGFLFLAVSFIVAFELVLTIGSCAQSRPNIIVIIPDDLGWSDVGYNGSRIKTPNIDKLEQSGIRLNFQYVMATCTPTRVGIFTGQYASNFGITAPDYGEVIPPHTPTMASLLKKKGYFTALVGKWHMGSPPDFIPIKYGFLSSYGYFAGQIDPYTHRYKKKMAFAGSRTWNGEGVYLKELDGKDSTHNQYNNERLYGFEFLDQKGHVTDLLTDRVIHLIKEKRNRPFFIYLAYSVPHFPLNEPQKWLSIYKNTFVNPSRRLFAASVSHMDAGIGRIIDMLNKTGQRDNTLILFISDNGAEEGWPKQAQKVQYKGCYANKPQNVLGNNFPLRGWKNTLYEGGIRVPAFISWPGHLSPGSLNIPVKWTDWLPTFLGLTGSSQKKIQGLNFNGKNLWPLLKGQEGKSDFENRTIFWETPNAYAIREGDWKLIKYKKAGKLELYNVKSDFREQYDLSRKNLKKLEELKGLLKTAIRR